MLSLLQSKTCNINNPIPDAITCNIPIPATIVHLVNPNLVVNNLSSKFRILLIYCKLIIKKN